jgi:hypothetical protein
MNFKEKITELLFEVVHINFSPKDVVKKILKLNDAYAVDFTDWCEERYYPSSATGIWFENIDFESAEKYTTKQLLKIYKKEKKL